MKVLGMMTKAILLLELLQFLSITDPKTCCIKVIVIAEYG